MRTAAKRDTPERACIAAAEALGAVVLQVSGVGLPDTLVLYKGRTYLVEVKRPGKGLTHAQALTFARIAQTGVSVYVVETPEQMRGVLAHSLVAWAPDARPVEGKKQRAHRPGVDKARTVEEMCKAHGCVTSRALGRNCCDKHPKMTDTERAELIPPPRVVPNKKSGPDA